MEADSARTFAGPITAGQAVCKHCGGLLILPEEVANGGARALEAFVDNCSVDCKRTEEEAGRLDDVAFEIWADSHLDRIRATMERGDVAAIPPPDSDIPSVRLAAQELFYRENWAHHIPEWIEKRRVSIEEDLASLAWRRPWWAFDPLVAKRAILAGVSSGIVVAIMKSCSLI